MAKRRIKTAANAIPWEGTPNNKPSKTVPDQAMSIEELIKNHMHLASIGELPKKVYSEDMILPPRGKYSLPELDEMRRDAQDIANQSANELISEDRERRKARKSASAQPPQTPQD